MSEENTQTTETQAPAEAKPQAAATPKTTGAVGRTHSRGAVSPKRTFTRGPRTTTGAPSKDGAPGAGAGPNGRPPRRGGDRGPRATFQDRKPEFEQKILSIRRVTRVVSGGRRLSFAVSMVIGDKKGAMGVGTGKAVDTALAITKALKNAKKNMVKLKLTKGLSIPHDVEAKYATARLVLRPNKGKGIVAGSAARDILKLGGLKDVTAKFHSGSKNKLNNARATIVALSIFAQKGGLRLPEEKEVASEEVVTMS